ncbi:MAG: hypothetical protein KJ622_17890 [Alphaproteobacteria bacterium]|nr:hypothetical protein [Alphaproteobacteria bacterium]
MESYLWQSALLMVVAYLLGAVLGCLLRRLFTSAPAATVATTRSPSPITTSPAAADAAMREAPEPVQPRIETVAQPSPPQEAKIAESARFERVLSSAPATAPSQVTTSAAPAAVKEQASAAGTSSAAAAAAAATAAVAAVIEGATQPASPPAQQPAQPAAQPATKPATKPAAKPAERLPTASGSSGQAAVAAPIAAKPADDLRRIANVDTQAATALNLLGYTRFDQIASWTAADTAKVRSELGSRAAREGWIEQAKILSSGKDTGRLQRLAGKTHVNPWTLPSPPAPASAAAAPVKSPAPPKPPVSPAPAAAATPAAPAKPATATPAAPARAATKSAPGAAAVAAAAAAAATAAVAKASTETAKPEATSTAPSVTPSAPPKPGPAPAKAPAQAPVAAPAQVPVAAPAPAPAPAPKPVAPTAPDDLLRIEGIDAPTQERLNANGITSYAQIAKFTASDVGKVDTLIGHKGRVSRENWIEQAKILVDGKKTAFAQRMPASPAVTPAPGQRLTRQPLPPSKGTATVAQAATATVPTPAAPPSLATLAATAATTAAAAAAATAAAATAAAGSTATPPKPADQGRPGSVAAAKGVATALRQGAANPPPSAPSPAPSQPPATAPTAAPATPPAAAPAPAASSAPPARPAKLAEAIKQNSVGNTASGVAGMRSVRSQLLSGEAGTPRGEVEDLKKIRGIGVLIEKKLNAMGIYSYDQIANWSAADIDRVSSSLDFKGRIEREGWVEQARILASGGQTEFSKRLN